jgi:hypothetical protein
MMAKKQD